MNSTSVTISGKGSIPFSTQLTLIIAFFIGVIGLIWTSQIKDGTYLPYFKILFIAILCILWIGISIFTALEHIDETKEKRLLRLFTYVTILLAVVLLWFFVLLSLKDLNCPIVVQETPFIKDIAIFFGNFLGKCTQNSGYISIVNSFIVLTISVGILNAIFSHDLIKTLYKIYYSFGIFFGNIKSYSSRIFTCKNYLILILIILVILSIKLFLL